MSMCVMGIRGMLPSKQWWLNTAEVIDAWRVFPRYFLLAYLLIVWRSTEWYMALLNPTEHQTDYIQWMWGAATAITGFYVATGRKWGG